MFTRNAYKLSSSASVQTKFVDDGDFLVDHTENLAGVALYSNETSYDKPNVSLPKLAL